MTPSTFSVELHHVPPATTSTTFWTMSRKPINTNLRAYVKDYDKINQNTFTYRLFGNSYISSVIKFVKERRHAMTTNKGTQINVTSSAMKYLHANTGLLHSKYTCANTCIQSCYQPWPKHTTNERSDFCAATDTLNAKRSQALLSTIKPMALPIMLF